jgi:biopolymer transport protein ExbB
MKLKMKSLLSLHFLKGKRTLALTALLAVMAFGFNNSVKAQEEATEEATTEMVEGDSSSTDSAAMAVAVEEVEEVVAPAPAPVEEVEEEKTFHQVLKGKFIDGGPIFMSFVLICLILGLALSIERILYLSLSTTNTKKLLNEVEGALSSNGVEGAKEVCRNTSGPVASIFYQGLERSDEGLDMVEKTVVSYGSVQLGLLEKGLSWISLFIALAPMLGFFGTVIGMIGAFDAIAAANNISPGIVANGIGVALITTVSGLLVAMVLQVFYNYILSTVDSIVNDMEDASISFIDLLVKHNAKK